MKVRLFIESDILHQDKFRTAQRQVALILDKKQEKYCIGVFDMVLDFAWHNLDKTWKAVLSSDEIYASTSLMPLISNDYTGAPVIFNGMCERAIKENVTGKSVFILRDLKDIDWDMIDFKLMKRAFKNNKLFMFDAQRDMVEINVSKIKK